jgi:hypothetical protein
MAEASDRPDDQVIERPERVAASEADAVQTEGQPVRQVRRNAGRATRGQPDGRVAAPRRDRRSRR